MKITFTPRGWADYTHWQGEDRRTLKRINALIQDITRNGNTGMGKPEQLGANLTGWWSRRIDQKHRLVYRITGDAGTVEIAACRYHYGDR